MHKLIAVALAGCILALTGCATTPAGSGSAGVAGAERLDPLFAGFVDPPASARPRTWWHWMNGNVTQEGIARDLAWMSRIGIGGVQNFDASLATPQIVDQRLVYMTPEWREAFRFAVSEADRHGLEFTIAASPGWSETGGPWVKPADGMKKLVWGETELAGGMRFRGRLVPPPTVTGAYQDAPYEDEFATGGEEEETHLPEEAGRIAVLAVPRTGQELPAPEFALADGTRLDTVSLTDRSIRTSVDLPLAKDLSGSVLVTFGQPVVVRSAHISIPGLANPFRGLPIVPRLQAEIDGAWRDVAELPLSSVPTTVGFEPVTAKRFRVSIVANPAGPGAGLDVPAPGAQSFDIFALGDLSTVKLAELRLGSEPSLSMLEQRAGFATLLDYHSVADRDVIPPGIDPAQVIDLTARVAADGTLDWTPPAGSGWKVYTFGWSLTGKTNHPATREATGLEVDKFDPAAVRRYLETYLGMYRDTLGEELFGERGLKAILTDSIEVGLANWTPNMEAEFAQRRGYSLRPWLPALAGVVLGSPSDSERFLFDWRETLAELLAEHHYGTVAQVAHEHGLRVYGEALENGRPLLGDDLAMRKYADVPMAAMWTFWRDSHPRWSLLGDMRGAASVAHVYGQNLVAAESMTSANAPWAFAPRDLRRIIDFEFANGVNLPVIHTSVHVPVEDRKPGLSLMIFGQYFNRNETWAEMARPWIDYIARNAYMLQQGSNVADIAIFTGEDAPLTAQYAGGPPPGLPTGYAFDYVNAEMLAEALTADRGQLVARGGASYRVLYLSGSSRIMTLPTLRRIANLAAQGVPIVGPRPRHSPSLPDDPAEFATLVEATWKLGNVIESDDIDAAMDRLGIAPAFETGTAPVLFVHRRAGEADLYFVNNRCACETAVDARFRATGKAPEWWDAVSGTTRPLSYTALDSATLVPLKLAAEESGFVVFRDVARSDSRETGPTAERTALSISGPWTVRFEEGRGAPAAIVLDELMPLSQHSDSGVRHFSGVATYTTSFALDPANLPAGDLWLDLGQIADVAEVFVNGRSAGITWFAPDRVNVGGLLVAGTNELEVRVANRWVNRLIGDRQPGAEAVTFTAAPTYRSDAQLVPSGLMGPVRILVKN